MYTVTCGGPGFQHILIVVAGSCHSCTTMEASDRGWAGHMLSWEGLDAYEHSGTEKKQKTGPDLGPHIAAGALAVRQALP